MPAATKRKRDQLDHGASTSHPPGPDFSHSSNFEAQYLHQTNDGDMHLAEALTQHNAGDMPHPNRSSESNGQSATDTANAALHYNLTNSGPQTSTFLVDPPEEHTEQAPEPNFDLESPRPATTTSFAVDQLKEASNKPSAPASTSPPAPTDPTSTSPPVSPATKDKLKVGSDEWQALRRNNHKEVERRRRETINEGINELGKIVPGAERNKGSILQSAVMYITDLKERQADMEQKNNLEKMMFEQAIAEMSASGDKLKAENRRLEEEVERWKRRAEGRE